MDKAEEAARKLLAKHFAEISRRAMTLDLKGNHIATLDGIVIARVDLKGAIAYIAEKVDDVVTQG